MFDTIASALLYLVVFIAFTMLIVGLIMLGLVIVIGIPTALLSIILIGIIYAVLGLKNKAASQRS